MQQGVNIQNTQKLIQVNIKNNNNNLIENWQKT